VQSARAFEDVTPGAGYSLAQTIPVGWLQIRAACSDGSPLSNIDVAVGETVTCTFVNQRGYPRPRGATPLRASLVPAYNPCTSPNRTHGPSLASPSCNPPAMSSPHLTVGTPDANGPAARMTGSIQFRAVLGDPGTPADEADVGILASITDVRQRSDLTDYAGELEGQVVLRITDRASGTGGNEVATASDIPFEFTIPCTATAAVFRSTRSSASKESSSRMSPSWTATAPMVMMRSVTGLSPVVSESIATKRTFSMGVPSFQVAANRR